MTASTSLAHRLQTIAGAHPDVPALLAPGRAPLTFAGLATEVERIATALRARGIGPGDRVVGTLERGPEAALCVMAVCACATYVPLDPAWTAAELTAVLARLAPRAVICGARAAPTMRAVAARLGIDVLDLVPAADAPAGTFALEGGHASTVPATNVPGGDDVALILCTSGTTGRPKLVPLRHRHLVAIADASVAHFGLGPQDRVLHTMSMFYANGLKSSLIAPLLSGCAVICPPRFDTHDFLVHLATLGATWYAASFTVHRAIADAVAARSAPVLETPLRFMVSGAGRLDARVAAVLERAFGAPLLNRYSMSETGILACEPLPPGLRRAGTAGRAVHNELAVVDGDGVPVPAGVEGDFVVRGPAVFDGYLDDAALNADVFRDGWFITGDRGTLDPDGYVTLSGRSRDVVNRGGEKIAPLEVERVLARHPGVVEVAVFGVAHPTLGEELAAAIVVAPGIPFDPRALVAFASRELARLKVPRRLHVVDAMPLTSAGKVDRRALAARFAALPDDGNDDPTRVPRGALEAGLAELWCALLKLDAVARDVDFFVAGGDSLHAAELLAAVRRRHGVSVPLRSIFGDGATIAGQALLVGKLRHARAGALPRGLLALNSNGTRAPLFAVPGRDADLGLFAPMAALLDIDHPLIGLVPPGLDGSVPPPRVEAIAAIHVRAIRQCQPEGPYHLLGACFGGFVAYEIACQLRDEGQDVAFLALVDPPPPFTHANGEPRGTDHHRLRGSRWLVLPRFILARVALYRREWQSLERGARRAWWRDKLRLASAVVRLSDPFRGDRGEVHMAAVVAANARAAATFRPRPYAGRVTLALAHERPLASLRNHRLDWLAWLPQAGAAVPVPGRDTGEIFRDPACAVMAAFVAQALAVASSPVSLPRSHTAVDARHAKPV